MQMRRGEVLANLRALFPMVTNWTSSSASPSSSRSARDDDDNFHRADGAGPEGGLRNRPGDPLSRIVQLPGRAQREKELATQVATSKARALEEELVADGEDDDGFSSTRPRALVEEEHRKRLRFATIFLLDHDHEDEQERQENHGHLLTGGQLAYKEIS
ncbi:unnamed protein product [Amoebophrya sp. A25]|nr:unnamed protein product [Amoebophrya sp. A25]|eukprot:GSA25T00003459001.1